MLTKFLNFVNKIKITPFQWVVGFCGILFVRFMLENISSQNNFGIITSDLSTLIHYLLFYLGLLLSLVLCLKIFIKIKISDLTKMALFILPITWLAPIIDLIITDGTGCNMSYNFHTSSKLITDFFTFFGTFDSGITLGIKIEIFIILIGISFLAYKHTKNIFKTILTLFLCYSIFFLWSVIPNITFIINDIFTNEFILSSVNNSYISKNILQTGVEFTQIVRNKEILFNFAMMQIFILINSLLLIIWSFIYNKNHIINILKNSRPQRFLFYFSFFIIGFIIAIKQFNLDINWSWFNITTFITILLGYFCVWLFAIGVNDTTDIFIDKISNKNRPLVKNIFDSDQLKQYNLIFLLFSLIASLAVGIYALFFMIIFIAVSYIYSAPPLRLKKIPVISTFLISIATLSMAMSSFYLISPNKTISAFPLNIIVLIIIVVTITANIKDLKDYEGDRTDNIRTIPTIFGVNKGRKIISIFTALSFLFIPIVLKNYVMLIPAIIMALLTYYLLNKSNFKDKYIFLMYFIFISIILIQY